MSIIETYIICKKICTTLEKAYYNLIALALMPEDWICRNLDGDVKRLVLKTKYILLWGKKNEERSCN